jgi:hypothetical protein
LLLLSPLPLIFSGVCGVIGGVVALFIADKTDLLDDKGKIGGVTFGVISGGAVGYRFGKTLGPIRGRCLCLECFNFFELEEAGAFDDDSGYYNE